LDAATGDFDGRGVLVSPILELMRWQDIGDVPCPVARSLSLIGDRWTMLILRDAFLRVRRFEAFQARIQVSRHRLAARLRKLVEAQILERVPYQQKPLRYEYRLTERGRDLYPVVVSLSTWGNKWLAGDDGPLTQLVHHTCGHKGPPELTCAHCHAPLGARDTYLEVKQ